ncbi:MAG: 50S ribosomal protein L29 [Candidatus Saganbacteria bacterium]|nr:50S ribosomal protein L29 [Candidatus Saganbacteria bacterium]
MKAKELKALKEQTVDELKRRADELRREYLGARLQHAGQQLKNPLKLRQLRRAIARVLTVINEKSRKPEVK